MSATKQELYDTIELIPDSIAKELLDYADYLTSKYIENTMPDELVIKDSADLKKKLSKRIEKIESGKAKMLTVDEAFAEIDNL